MPPEIGTLLKVRDGVATDWGGQLCVVHRVDPPRMWVKRLHDGETGFVFFDQINEFFGRAEEQDDV